MRAFTGTNNVIYTNWLSRNLDFKIKYKQNHLESKKAVVSVLPNKIYILVDIQMWIADLDIWKLKMKSLFILKCKQMIMPIQS